MRKNEFESNSQHYELVTAWQANEAYKKEFLINALKEFSKEIGLITEE